MGGAGLLLGTIHQLQGGVVHNMRYLTGVCTILFPFHFTHTHRELSFSADKVDSDDYQSYACSSNLPATSGQ